MSNVFEHVVIGSGPSGWAAIEAIVERGGKPVVVDIGLEENNKSFESSSYSKNTSQLALKKRFNSDYMYKVPPMQDVIWDCDGSLPTSSAFGGLSTVWGSNIQGFEWPSNDLRQIDEFNFSQKVIASKINHTGARDGLDSVYKWPIDFQDSTPMSKRSRKILRRLQKYNDSTFLAGMARNATAGRRTGCLYCGLCLDGCPEGVIFSTEKYISDLIKKRKITYVKGMVNSVDFQNEIWNICITSLETETPDVKLQANKVFLGAGTIQTAVILSRSNIVPNKIKLHDTQVCYLPFLNIFDKSEKKTGYSLAQIFIETIPSLFEKESFHVSLYEHSESFKERAKSISPIFSKFIPKFMYRRLIAGIAFLSSENSGDVVVSKSVDQISVTTEQCPNSKNELNKILQKLMPRLIKSGLFPLKNFITLPNPGASYHLGALSDYITNEILLDENGCVEGFPRLHVIDGCSLPKIPAGPITFGIMSNAHRIAWKNFE